MCHVWVPIHFLIYLSNGLLISCLAEAPVGLLLFVLSAVACFTALCLFWPTGIPWQTAALKSTAQDDPHFKLFRPVLRPKGGSTAGASRPQQLAEAGPVIGLVGSRALNVPAYDSAWDDLRLNIQVGRAISLVPPLPCRNLGPQAWSRPA